jgi:hypothetical protein
VSVLFSACETFDAREGVPHVRTDTTVRNRYRSLQSLSAPCRAAILLSVPLVSAGAPAGGAGAGLTAEIPIEAHINEIAQYFDIADIGALRGVVSVKKTADVSFLSLFSTGGTASLTPLRT